ncbi:hypothetical protein [Streptomyces sp. NPDC005953]
MPAPSPVARRYAAALPQFQQGESWWEIGVDDSDQRRERYPEPASR